MPIFLIFFRTLFDEGRLTPHPLAGCLPVQCLLDFLCAEGWDVDDAPLYCWVTRRGGLKDGPYSLAKCRPTDTLEKAFGPIGKNKTVVELFVMKKDEPADLNAFLGALVKKYHFDHLTEDARAPVAAACADKSCRSTGKHVCTKCLQTTYCSKQCEQAHLSLHKPVCSGVPQPAQQASPVSQTPPAPQVEEELNDEDAEQPHKRQTLPKPIWHIAGESAPPLLSGMISGDFEEPADDPYTLDDYELDLGPEEEEGEGNNNTNASGSIERTLAALVTMGESR
eukprot:TRINITY_DN2667_c0_g1_i1.p1 TRINITY_DN2667_c0_g1~~TRINITY_DN2667_c0_g1_i1.p1  ORF type:complete len:299 (+),score=43.47 TRINITY_DN2667_c0_g1_i1:57-899(+)